MDWVDGLTAVIIILVIAGFVYAEASTAPFSDNGVCCDKYISNGTCFVQLGHNTHKIDNDLYGGIVLGQQYDASGNHGIINYIQLYCEDSGL